MFKTTKRVGAVIAIALLALVAGLLTAVPAQAAGGSVSLSGQYCKDEGAPAYVLDVVAGDTDYTFTASYGTDVLAPWHQQQFTVPANTFQQVELNFSSLAVGQYFFIWATETSSVYFSQDDHLPGDVSTKFVLDCSYDPYAVTVGFTYPTCFDGVLDSDLEITSFNEVYGENIIVKLDDVQLIGPDDVDPMTTVVYQDVVPVNTPVGDHVLYVYSAPNHGDLIVVGEFPFTITEPCVAVSPSDFTAALGEQTENPDGTTTNLPLKLGSTSDASRQTLIWNDGVFVGFPVLLPNSEITFDLTIPCGESVPIQVSFGFPDLGLDEVVPAFDCSDDVPEPPVLVSGPTITGAAKVGSTLTCNVDYTGDTSISFGWLSDAAATSGTNSTRVLTAADLGHRFACATSASNADGTTATSTSASSAVVAVGPALKVVTKPSIVGKSRVGRTLTARAGTWTPGATDYDVQWYINGVAKKGATGFTYKIRAADKNKRIKVLVTAKAPGHPNGKAFSPYVVV